MGRRRSEMTRTPLGDVTLGFVIELLELLEEI